MLTLERVKELSGEQDMSDERAKIFRDSAQGMAEIVFEMIREKRKKGLLPKIVYRQVEDADGAGHNRAYDILFEEVVKLRNNKNHEQ